MATRVLVPVDISQPADTGALLDIAEDHALRDKAELHVLCVMPSFGMPMVGAYFNPDSEAMMLESARTQLSELLNARPARGCAISAHVAQGTVYDEILKAADKLACDLIIMAAHRPELRDYLLGPNAARVVRHARQSVLVVRRA